MHRHKIGVVDSLDRVGPLFDRCDLIVVSSLARTSRKRWWRSPLVALNETQVHRLNGVAVVHGPKAAVLPRLDGLPDPVILVVSSDPAPAFGLKEKVEWIELKSDKVTADLVIVLSAPGSAEVCVYDLME